jgi:hypothetical protein
MHGKYDDLYARHVRWILVYFIPYVKLNLILWLSDWYAVSETYSEGPEFEYRLENRLRS